MKTRSSGPAAPANVVSAFVTSSFVARPETRVSPFHRLANEVHESFSGNAQTFGRVGERVAPAVKRLGSLGVSAETHDDEEEDLQHPDLSGQSDEATVAPLRADQTHERNQDDGHVPQFAFFNRRDAAARVADVLGKALGSCPAV